MRKKWLKLKYYFFSILLVLSPFQTVYAEDKPSEVFKDGFRYSDIIKYLDRFTSKMWVEKEFWGFGSETAYLINSIVQSIFWLNKIFYYIFSGIYKYLSNSSAVDEYVDTAISAGASIYGSLSGSVQKWAIVFMILYAAYVYFVENGDFFKLLLRFFVVYICSAGMFYNHDGKYILRHAYDNMKIVTEEIATSSLDNLSLTGTTSGSSLLSLEKGDAVVEEYFRIAVWKPYQYMNSTLEIIGPMGGERKQWSVTEEELKSLLDYDSGNDGFEIVTADGTKQKISSFVGKGDSIKQKMLSAYFGDKFMYALASIFDTFVLGIILDGFAIMSFSMSLLFLLLCLLSGGIALASLIPTFENALMNFWKRALGVMMVSGLGSILSLFVLWFYNLLSGILETAFFGNMFLAVIAKVVIFWYMWKKRDLILSILTANRVTQLSNGFTRRISSYGNRARRRMTRNAMSRLSIKSRPENGGAGRKLKGLSLAGAGAGVLVGRRLSQTKLGRSIGNKFRDSKTVDGLAKVGDGFATAGRRLLGAKDYVASGYSTLQSLASRKGIYGERAINFRQRARERMAKSSSLYDSRVRARNAKDITSEQRVHNDETKERLKAMREHRRLSVPNRSKTSSQRIQERREGEKSIVMGNRERYYREQSRLLSRKK